MAASDAASHRPTARYDACVPRSDAPASETPSTARPQTASVEPSCSTGDRGTPVNLETITARIPIPPAAVACTSESGARASAST